MNTQEICAAAMGRTLAEIIDLGETLYIENQRISQAAKLLLRSIESGGSRQDNLTVQLIRSIRDTADHCCRVIEGPR
ncbi:hypothetical protein [Pleomorphomonas koreensis]|uniref:hypothetical protein n=1 Tax=Pleomorphomonas koreensis TaxID=257440 RepID=UPI00040F6A83|nr:hypothetical protein [Pleomorphomonas koreensis]